MPTPAFFFPSPLPGGRLRSFLAGWGKAALWDPRADAHVGRGPSVSHGLSFLFSPFVEQVIFSSTASRFPFVDDDKSFLCAIFRNVACFSFFPPPTSRFTVFVKRASRRFSLSRLHEEPFSPVLCPCALGSPPLFFFRAIERAPFLQAVCSLPLPFSPLSFGQHSSAGAPRPTARP